MLLGADKGEGLLLVRGNRIPLQVGASDAEYALATTNPRDLDELAAAAAVAPPQAPPVPTRSHGADHGSLSAALAARRASTVRSANGASHAALD